MTGRPTKDTTRRDTGHPDASRVRRRRYGVGAGPGLLALVMALGTAGCQRGDVGTEPDPDVPAPTGIAVIVSNTLSGTASLGVTPAMTDGEVAYVSLPSGTVPPGRSARILNRRTGAVVVTSVILGGFDPVPVGARAGDTLRVEVRWPEGGGGVVAAELSVPPRRPPVIVRTQPPPGKRDIPLNATLLVVFSEPIDPATLTPPAIQLLGGGTPVPGTAHPVPGYPWMVEFTPAAPLAPDAAHELVLTPAVRDQDGEALEAGARVPFTTGSASSGQPPARLRVVHADDEVSPFYVVVDGSVMTTLRHMEVSAYAELAAGPHHIEVITGAGWLEDSFPDFVAGVDYTFLPCCALLGGFGSLLSYDHAPPAAGHARLRLVNYARLTTAHIYVTVPGADLEKAVPTFSLNVLDASGFLELPAGQYQVRVTRWDSKTVVVDSGILTLGDGQVRTAIALDRRAGGGGSLLVLSDRN